MYKKNPWIFFSMKHQCASLCAFSKSELVSLLSYLQINTAKIRVCKTNLIVNIVKLFENRCLELAIKNQIVIC